MTDLRTFITHMTENLPPCKKNEFKAISAFLINNNWVGCTPTIENGIPMLSPEQIQILSEPIRRFLTEENTDAELLKRLAEKFPETAKLLFRFYRELRTDEDSRVYLTDFLLFRLTKDLFMYNDTDIQELLKIATDDMLKQHGDTLVFFLAWMRTKIKTKYYKDYIMEKRYTMDVQNEAYDFDEYLELVYKLFNSDYIEKNDMYLRAAESKNYTDTWLYLSMHFVCSLRYTDLERIYRPILPFSPEECIERIKEDTFSENDARLVLLSVIQRMCTLPLTPHKNEDKHNINSVKLCIPSSCEMHFGKLFALAEAHRQMQGDYDRPLIKKISTYDQIKRYMGGDIGDLFLENDFLSRSATKSYLQNIFMVGNEMSEGEDGLQAKGYLLASFARSHKGSYGNFASTTFEYLKDAKLNGLTPEFVAFELFERGVLSFISSELLNMVTGQQYAKLTVKNQTELVKELGLSPMEIETVVSTVDAARKQSYELVRAISGTPQDSLEILHRIGSGQAFSKQPECMCLLTALGKECPYAEKRQCVGCEHEIGTKSTMFLLISEYNRMMNLYQDTDSKLEKKKYKKLITEVIVPHMDEMLTCIRETYGEEVFHQYEQLIKENTSL
ncbi:MAG: hypothetical protein IKB07_05430 [Lachnospiraceae bacterium]|nr:hypothetical protein [Lachnospiraceae bacterium]